MKRKNSLQWWRDVVDEIANRAARAAATGGDAPACHRRPEDAVLPGYAGCRRGGDIYRDAFEEPCNFDGTILTDTLAI